MTTFEDAARAEAGKRVNNRLAGRFSVAELIGWFVAGAVWARDHLAEQEASDAEVLAALNAAGHVFSPDGHADAEVEAAVDSLSNRPGITYGVSRDILRVLAREALRAAARVRKEQE